MSLTDTAEKIRYAAMALRTEIFSMAPSKIPSPTSVHTLKDNAPNIPSGVARGGGTKGAFAPPPHFFRIFSGFFQDFFRIFSGFFQDFFRFFQDFFRIFSGFFQDFFRIFSGFFQDFFRIFSGFFQDFFRIFSGFFRILKKFFLIFLIFFKLNHIL